jgi:hypothetical protein
LISAKQCDESFISLVSFAAEKNKQAGKLFVYRGEQNNRSTKKLRIEFVLATLKELLLATLNVLPFVYTL